MRAALLALFVAACTSAPQDLPPPELPQRAGVDPMAAMRAEGVRYLARGTAPDHQLRFFDDRIALTLNSGETWFTFPRTEPTYPRWNGEIYYGAFDGHQIEIEVHHNRDCPEGSGQDLVITRLDAVTMFGCGHAL